MGSEARRSPGGKATHTDRSHPVFCPARWWRRSPELRPGLWVGCVCVRRQPGDPGAGPFPLAPTRRPLPRSSPLERPVEVPVWAPELHPNHTVGAVHTAPPPPGSSDAQGWSPRWASLPSAHTVHPKRLSQGAVTALSEHELANPPRPLRDGQPLRPMTPSHVRETEAGRRAAGWQACRRRGPGPGPPHVCPAREGRRGRGGTDA